MKKHTDVLLTFLAIAVLAGLIFAVYESKRPAPVVIDLSKQPEQSPEHHLIGQILKDTEAFVQAEDQSIQSASPVSHSQAPLPVAGAPLPVAWESLPAPNIDEAELSPSLQRSLAASASLRTEDYMNPSSDLNLERIANLRAIRQARHSQ